MILFRRIVKLESDNWCYAQELYLRSKLTDPIEFERVLEGVLSKYDDPRLDQLCIESELGKNTSGLFLAIKSNHREILKLKKIIRV